MSIGQAKGPGETRCPSAVAQAKQAVLVGGMTLLVAVVPRTTASCQSAGQLTVIGTRGSPISGTVYQTVQRLTALNAADPISLAFPIRLSDTVFGLGVAPARQTE